MPARRSLVLVPTLLVALLAVPLTAAPATAEEGTHSPNMTHVANLQYPKPAYSTITNGGTDIEFASIARRVATEGGFTTETREYALAGSYDNGLQIVDITEPRTARIIATYECGIRQGDVQVFTRGKRTYAAYTHDDPYTARRQSRCYQEAAALGLFQDGVTNPAGTFIVDITNPFLPRTVSFFSEPRGSHNSTVAPGGGFIYNSNSDIAARVPQIEVWDIRNFLAPQRVFVLNTVTGLSSHDITFSEDGTRAYSAAVTHTLVLDTTKLAEPRIIGRIIDPAVNIHHQSDPVTLTDANTGMTRTFLVVTDELAGAAGNGLCPGGGLHVYDVTGSLEQAPVKVGFWNMPEIQPATDNLTCTSHVLRMYPEEKLMTIAWYNAGVRVVDISGLMGVSVGVDEASGNVGMGMREIGYYYFADSDTWSVKTNRIADDGSFYLYGNDQNRGLDVYRFAASAPEAADAGTWMSGAESVRAARADGLSAGGVTGPYCLYRGLSAA